MSWMLPTVVPGLLIAATVGLDRLEIGLGHRLSGRGADWGDDFDDTAVPPGGPELR